MHELKILAAAVADRKHYEEIKDHVRIEDFGPESKLIWQHVGEYYATDSQARSADVEMLGGRISRSLPNPKHSQAVLGILKSLPEVSGINVVREVLDLRSQGIGLELAAKIVGGGDKEELRKLTEEYSNSINLDGLEDEKEELANVSLKDLVASRLDTSKLIQIAPKALNDRLEGGALPGHHVVVFAPTEMGKTLFVLNMVAHFLKCGHKTLYVGNEDPAEDILLRLYGRIAGANRYQLRDSPDKYWGDIQKGGIELFTFLDLAPGTFSRIERSVKKHQPKVLVLDQLSNINVITSRNESKTGNLEQAAKEARGLAKRHGLLVVSVTQAADSATGKSVLGRGDIHNSNVGIPGQADLIIGIGADEQMESRGLRTLSLVKDKISGNHDSFQVTFDPILSRVH